MSVSSTHGLIVWPKDHWLLEFKVGKKYDNYFFGKISTLKLKVTRYTLVEIDICKGYVSAILLLCWAMF